MLLSKLEPAQSLDRHHCGPQAGASARPALQLVVSRPRRVDGFAVYPCTRMHGAAFESEFYAELSESGMPEA